MRIGLGSLLRFHLIIIISSFGFGSYSQTSREFKTELIELPCINIYAKRGALLVIQNQNELESLMNDSPFLHPDCDVDNLPKIDFDQYTLLAYSVVTGGCEDPQIDYGFLRNEKSLTLSINIIQKGICRVMIIKNLWWLTPKMEPFPKVKIEQREY